MDNDPLRAWREIANRVSGPAADWKKLSEQMAGPAADWKKLSGQMAGPAADWKKLSEQMAGPAADWKKLSEQTAGPAADWKKLSEQTAGPAADWKKLSARIVDPFKELRQVMGSSTYGDPAKVFREAIAEARASTQVHLGGYPATLGGDALRQEVVQIAREVALSADANEDTARGDEAVSELLRDYAEESTDDDDGFFTSMPVEKKWGLLFAVLSVIGHASFTPARIESDPQLQWTFNLLMSLALALICVLPQSRD